MTKGRKVMHHGEEIDTIDGAWWAEAGMENFAPSARAYVADPSEVGDSKICEIPIDDFSVVSVERRSVGIFKDNEKRTAGERVVRILKGFVSGDKIPPVKFKYDEEPGRCKLVDGAHRFYCSVAAGFSHVPAVKGFDITTLDQ